MKRLCITLLLVLVSSFSEAQDSTKNYNLSVGIRCKKFTGFYWENGFTGEFSSSKILKGKVTIGFNLVSSRLGTDIARNGISTLETEVSLIKYFRPTKNLHPLLRLNAGYAHANYGSSIFNSLPSNGALLSLETGVSYSLPVGVSYVKLNLTGGYNVFYGNGSKGLGTVYPFFGQFSILYYINKNKILGQ